MTRHERTVLVDMDGVLADFEGRLIGVLRAEHPTIPIPTVRRNFHMDDDMHEAYRPVVRGIIDRPGFYAELPVRPDAHRGWERLLELGYRPRICSAQRRENPTSIPDKLNWLERHFAPVFGAWVVETAIIDRNKGDHDGVALIDDKPAVRGAEKASWQHIVFDAPYNQTAPSDLRLYGWSDPRLGKLLEKAAA